MKRKNTLLIISLLLIPALAFILYTFISTGEENSLQYHVEDNVMRITSSPGIADYSICTIAWLVLLSFTYIIIRETCYDRHNRENIIAAFSKNAKQYWFILLPAIITVSILTLKLWTSFDTVIIDADKMMVQVHHGDNTLKLDLHDVQCIHADIEKVGRHTYLNVYCTMKKYPPLVYKNLNWKHGKGLELLSHPVSSVQEQTRIAGETNRKIAKVFTGNSCR